jgi:farnesyl diphosphate synthase
MRTMLLTDLTEIFRVRTEKLIDNYITNSGIFPAELKKSLGYSVLNGGKRVRPLLVFAAGLALGGKLENLDAPAVAIELIHSYSLVHDDLPAMDNADLRRGKPSCHTVFGAALAILAGDGLQTLAFQILAEHPCDLSAEQRLQMVQILSAASGISGMVAGQALDILGKVDNLNDLTQLQQLKTGALLTASVKLGMAGANQWDAGLINFADNIGLAFQIQDDLLDLESDTETLGKPQGIDAINKKITYPQLLGAAKSRQKILELTQTALASLQHLGENGALLRAVAEYLLQRKC